MTFRPDPLPLDEVARRTGQPIRRLRLWCATGLLQCEHDGVGWALPEADLPRVVALATERDGRSREARRVALTIPKPLVTADVVARIERELAIAPGEISFTSLMIDGEEQVIAVWPSPATLAARATRADAAARLAEEIGGDLIEIDVASGDGERASGHD